MLPAAETIFKIVVSLTCAATKKSAVHFVCYGPGQGTIAACPPQRIRTHILVISTFAYASRVPFLTKKLPGMTYSLGAGD